MLYRVQISSPLPGRLAAYLLRSKIGIALQEKHGSKLIGQWRQISGNVKRIITLWAYADFAAYEKCQGGLRSDPDAQEFARQEQDDPANGEVCIEFFEPTENSPLQ